VALRIEAEGLRQTFNRKTIFTGVSFAVGARSSLMIAGRNGSGKSTLVKIICGVLTPSAGTVSVSADDPGDQFAVKARIGLVAPYLEIYEEFSAMENLHLSMTLRGFTPDDDRARALLQRVALDPQRTDPVRGFSSGMKQRLKYAMALIHRPPVLILDEPMSNLDTDGIAIVRLLMQEQLAEGILVVATNDRTDLVQPDREVDLNAQR
jgi:heme exporter protein A